MRGRYLPLYLATLALAQDDAAQEDVTADDPAGEQVPADDTAPADDAEATPEDGAAADDATADDADAAQDGEPDADAQAILDELTTNGLNTLAEALANNPDLVDPLIADTDGWTVLGPEDAVLSAAAAGLDEEDLRTVLTYHVSLDPFDPSVLEDGPAVIRTALEAEGLDGEGQVLIASLEGEDVVISYGTGSATVTNAIEADPNWIHVINAVLLPPKSPSEVAAEAGLTELTSALTAADLVDAVDSETSITIFAPSNEAFAAATVDEDALSDTLLYHVVTDVAYSVGLESGMFETLQGKTVDVQVAEDGSVTVNGANVVTTDVLTNNGVVHVIDAVLDPEDGGDAAEADEPQDDSDETAQGADSGVGKVSGGLFAALAVALLAA